MSASDGQKSLNAHITLIQKMIKKVEKTEFEEKWKNLSDLINTTER